MVRIEVEVAMEVHQTGGDHTSLLIRSAESRHLRSSAPLRKDLFENIG
jgi:hypothetical protein